MRNEQTFWKKTAEALHPGWSVSIDERTLAATGGISSHDSFVYAVDLTSGWLGATALSSMEMMRAASNVKNEPGGGDTVRSGAPGTVATRGKKMPDAGSPEALEALAAAVLGVTQSSVFDKVNAATGGDVRGHWFYIVYGLRNGDLLGRALFVGNERKAFLSQSDVRDVARKIWNIDSNPATNVGRSIAEGGGAIFAPGFN